MNISKQASATFPKQGDILSPDNMYNIGIVGTALLEEVDKLVQPFKSTTARIDLIQPSPRDGITFFYSNTQGRINPVMDIEMKVLSSINEDAPIDLFVIVGNNTIKRLEDDIDRVNTIKEFSPNAQILLVCDNPDKTIDRLNKIKNDSNIDGLKIIGDDNIVTWEQSHSEIISRTGATPPQYIERITNYTVRDNLDHSSDLVKAYNELPSIARAREISDELNGRLPTITGRSADDYRSSFGSYDPAHDL